MSSITPFKFQDSVEVRTVTNDSGEVLFVGKDVCDALGYTNASKAIGDHCKGVTIRYPLQTAGGVQEARVLTEADVLRLIVNSKLPAAEAFERWVFEEVLPSIRKTGSYTAPAAQPTPKPKQPRIKQPSQVKELLLIGKEMAKITGINPHLVMAYTLDAIEQVTDLPASMLARALPAVAPAEVASLNPTAIGKQLGGLKAHAVNQMLLKAGLQRQDGSGWQLTEAGTAFGEMKPFHRNGHSGYNLLWLPKVVQLLQNINAQPAH